MSVKRFASVTLALLIVIAQSSSIFAKQSQSDDQSSGGNRSQNSSQSQNEGSQTANRRAGDVASRFRDILPVIPSLDHGADGLLTLFGRRATQNQFVSSTNVKDHATDVFPFRADLPVEAAEDVQIPSEQFALSQAKFYFTVPSSPRLVRDTWHYSFANPYFSLRHDDGVKGVRSADPRLTFGGPLMGGRLALFNSFEYRLSKRDLESVGEEDEESEEIGESGRFLSRYQSYDWNTRLSLRASANHRLSARFALFSQDIDAATPNALAPFETTPDYFMGGGQVYFSDNYTVSTGVVLSSSLEVNKLRVRVLPRGDEPMVLTEQFFDGNYFDTLRRSSSRIEWKESLRLPEQNGWGRHLLSVGGGLTRRAFDSERIGNQIIFTGEEDDDLHSIVAFTGSPFESLSAREATGWAEDRWSPVRRAQLTFGLRYDWNSISTKNQWSPRMGFALLPFKNDRTVVRGGMGVFYERMPLTAGTFTSSRQRLVQFFEEGEPITEPRALLNLTSSPRLNTAYTTGWNLELDQQIMSRLFLRLKAEDRRGRDILLLTPNDPSEQMSALILSDRGSSRYREVEATASFRLNRSTDLNASYIRSSSVGDRNSFLTTYDTFEKLFVSKARYGRSPSDTPHRFLSWGNISLPGGFILSPAFEARTGHIFSFTDGDGDVPNEAEFGRLPRLISLDLGGYRDFKVRTLSREGALRLGFKIYNLTNHFNPRDALVGENSEETAAEFKGFLNNFGRSYRVSLTLDF